MEIPSDLVRRLKRLRLGGLLPTLPDRAAHARQAKLSPVEFLELLLQDEIDRRDSQGLTRRIEVAGFEEVVTPEQIVWDTSVSFDRPRVRDKRVIEVYDPQFLAGHPDLTVAELAAYLEMVHAYEQRIAAGELPTRDEYAARPYGYAETVAYIRSSAEHLRAVCAAEGLPLEPAPSATVA